MNCSEPNPKSRFDLLYTRTTCKVRRPSPCLKTARRPRGRPTQGLGRTGHHAGLRWRLREGVDQARTCQCHHNHRCGSKSRKGVPTEVDEKAAVGNHRHLVARAVEADELHGLDSHQWAYHDMVSIHVANADAGP